MSVPQLVAEWGLGEGESSVIALALELGAVAVIDDRNARRCAKALGVPLIGTLGVIIRARKRALILAAKPLIQSVIDAGLHYPEDATLLSNVGENWR